ncbi:MAG: lysine transporter LysE, partial [Deltaproteobacteria bacterium]|nr:lysine transporter LysE [Deltaproteobacteria bacterium]
MFELAAIFGGSFTLALSGVLMPGPLLTVTVAESARIGFRAGPLLITGHAVLELLLV